MKIFYSLLLSILLSSTLLAQTSIDSVANHKDWGWDAVVLQNQFITLSVVPDIGARIMQYEFDGHESIFVNPDETGNIYAPSASSGWPNFGGYKTWPAPQDNWGWPPPPTLDHGDYTSVIEVNSPDSVTVLTTSPIEQWRTPELQFERRTTIYRNSTRVRVEQTIINTGNASADWSVWDVTQNIVEHDASGDFENFWVYFPINPESIWGEDGVRTSAPSSAWQGEVAPGVYGVRFFPEGKKIFADSHLGWISYVDERDGYTYIKTFDIYPDQIYPDQGARVEVWINSSPRYLEVEVLSPIVTLAANGGRYTFVEEWWATRLSGPTLFANRIGAIETRLAFDSTSSQWSGTYGVYEPGTLQLVFTGAGGDIDSGIAHAVTPDSTFALQEARNIPDGAERVELRFTNAAGHVTGVLEGSTIEPLLNISGAEQLPSGYSLAQNYPNPFNPTTIIEYRLSRAAQASLNLYNISGQLVEIILSKHHQAGIHTLKYDAGHLPGGIYFYELVSDDGFSAAKKMVLLK